MSPALAFVEVDCGDVAAVLTKKPADLTQITKGHAGTFPEEWVRQFIDGSDMISRAWDRRDAHLGVGICQGRSHN